MIPLIILAVIMLCLVVDKPLATTNDTDIVPQSMDIDGAGGAALATAGIALEQGFGDAATGPRPEFGR